MHWIILLTVLLAACGPDATPPRGLSRETFVNVYVELGRVRDDATPAEFEARKQEILRRHHVSESELKAFVDAHGNELDFMAEVWDSVRQRLTAKDSLTEQRGSQSMK